MAQLPNRRGFRPVAGAVAGVGALLEGVTDGRSLLVVTALSCTVFLHGCGLVTNWAGIWDEHARRSRERAERHSQLPLGRSGIGKGIISLRRTDHPSNRGMQGVAAVFGSVVVGIITLLIGIGVLQSSG